MKVFVIAKIFIVNEAGEVLALRRSETDVRRPLQWDFPGGFVNPGEEMLVAIKREATEETGLTVHNPQLVYAISEMDPNGAGTWLVFVAHVAGRPEVAISDEHDTFEWMTPRKLLGALAYDRQIRMLQYILNNHLLEPLDDA